MSQFRNRPGTKSVVRRLEQPFPDITAFDTVLRSLVRKNPLGCKSYAAAKRVHPPVEIVRQMYTAKFVYLNDNGKQVGTGLDRYDSVEGYETGVAAVISNMANIAAHRGKVRHLPSGDLFSALLKCHDADGEMYFLSLARDRLTLSSFKDDRIVKRVRKWADGEALLK